MNKMLSKLILLIMLSLLAAVPLHAKESKNSKQPRDNKPSSENTEKKDPRSEDVIIKADSMSQNNAEDEVIATGNVVVSFSGMTMHADRAVYNRKTSILKASGNLVITQEEDQLRGDSGELDIQTGLGKVDNARLFLAKSKASITSKQVIRLEESLLELNVSELTTCDQPDPDWKFNAEKMRVNLLGYAIGRNVIFYVKDVPVLYLPWIAVPVVRDKKSGLLPPRLGYSKKRGAQIDIPLYLVISPSQDLMVDLDLMTRRGAGLGANYRYIRKRGSEGTLGGYITFDAVTDKWRGQLVENHKEIFSADMNLRSAINLTSDRQFNSDYSLKIADYNRQSDVSTVNFLKTWQHYALTSNIRYSKDYYAANDSNTLQTVPDIGLSAVRQQFFRTPLYFDMDAVAANFYRESGSRGQRLDMFPRLTVLTGKPGYLNISAYAGAHLLAYNSYHIPVGSNINQNDGTVQPETGVKISSSLSRVYEIGGERLKKLRHEIVPEISYRYAQDKDQSRLPFYDYNDRLIHQNVLYYGITSHLGGKFESGSSAEYRTISRIRLLHAYSINGSRRDLLSLVETGQPLSDIILETETWFNPRMSLSFDARYNVYDNRLSHAAPGVEYSDEHGNTAAVNYSMSRNTVNPASQIEYMQARLSTSMFRPWTFSYLTRYSFDRGGFLESVYSAEYRHKCWSVVASFHDRAGNPSFSFSFNLIGLTTGSSTPPVQEIISPQTGTVPR